MLANVNSKCSAVSPSGINQNHPAALEIVRISSKQGTLKNWVASMANSILHSRT